jgi:4-aminobutyrate aminotransferase-like enzyme/Ser/Thr protein kinase RdoA (MazF antagonist)
MGKADPLHTAPPTVSPDDAIQIPERVFGLTGTVSPLDSERDRNFRLIGEDGRSYLLKISNSADERAVLEMQTQAMLHIARSDPELPVMRPLPTLDGGFEAEVEDAEGFPLLVRLFTFLPGRSVQGSELSPGSIVNFGATVARIGLAMRDFFHPAGGYEILWDLKHTAALRPLLASVADAHQGGLAATVIDRFDARVASRLPGLRAQMVHNDLTLDNVLLDDGGDVSGIVDFGDLTHTALICDLAVAIVSLMWERPDPIEAARLAIQGYVSKVPIEEGEAEVLGDLVGARLAALVLIADQRVRRYPENAEYILANVPAAWTLLEWIEARTWDGFGSDLARACLLPTTRGSASPRGPTDLLDRRRLALGPAQAPLSYDEPLYLVRGEGSRLFDHEGRAFLDAYNNVPVVGHCHPRVVEAIADQSARLNTNARYLHESVVELAERISGTLPPELDTVMFFNSGSEANDIAWRLATACTGGTGAIVTSFAYHGVTTATIALSPEEWVKGDRPRHVETIPPPDGYRGAHPREEEGWAQSYAAYLDEAIAALEARETKPAAVFIDAGFTSDGIFSPPPDYLQRVVDRVHEAGFLFVADEVQCGFGRLGTHLWGHEGAGIVPDLVTLGKPMGNGHPVAAVVTRAEIAERFAQKTDIFSTFGGNPVACRAALAVLDVLEEENLQRNALDVGAHLRAQLDDLREKHPSIGEVRGAGLLIGVELVRERATREPAPEVARAVINRMRDKGVLIGTTGPQANVLKIRPPLVLTTEEADEIAQRLNECLGELA